MKSKKSPLPEIAWQWIVVSVLAFCAALIAAWNIDYPGVYYDEILFGNAALFGESKHFVSWDLFGVPVLLMPYIGALKAWVYWPLFQLFGVDPLVIRLPSILLGVAGALFLVVAVGIWFGKGAALFCACLTLFDPSLLLHSRLDWGPTALMFFFRGLAVLGIALWWKKRTPSGIWLTLGACTLGSFDKLNFVWIVLGLFIGVTFVFYRELAGYYKKHRPSAKWQIALLVLVIGVFFTRAAIISQTPSEGDNPNYGRIFIATRLIYLTLLGTGPLDFVAGDGMTAERWMLPGYIAAGVTSLLCVMCCRGFTWKPWCFLAVFAFAVASAFICTGSATGPHHSAVLAGIPGVLLAPLLTCAPVVGLQQSVKALLTGVRVLALCSLSAAMIYTTLYSVAEFATPKNSNWDVAHNKLAELVQAYPNAYFRTGDWGLGTQLIAYSHGRAAVNDNWPEFANEKTDPVKLLESPDGSPTILVVHSNGRANFADANQGAIQAMHRSGIPYSKVRSFPDWQGEQLIEAFIVQSRAPIVELRKGPDHAN